MQALQARGIVNDIELPSGGPFLDAQTNRDIYKGLPKLEQTMPPGGKH